MFLRFFFNFLAFKCTIIMILLLYNCLLLRQEKFSLFTQNLVSQFWRIKISTLMKFCERPKMNVNQCVLRVSRKTKKVCVFECVCFYDFVQFYVTEMYVHVLKECVLIRGGSKKCPGKLVGHKYGARSTPKCFSFHSTCPKRPGKMGGWGAFVLVNPPICLSTI